MMWCLIADVLRRLAYTKNYNHWHKYLELQLYI